MNGYAQLVVRDGITFVKVLPPDENGKKQDVNELVGYLENYQLQEYSIKDLSKLCNDSDGVTELRVGPAPYRPYDERFDMDVSEDKMLVFCKFYPASEGGITLTEDEIIKHLQQYGIKFGIDREAIGRYLSNREYNREILMAKGQPPKQGKDGRIEYFFNTSLNTKPKKNPDGTVNYHELNTVSIVQAGQRLAVLIPEEPGIEGMNVYGNEVAPRAVKTPTLQFGNNITISEDGKELISNVTGHANLINGSVFVSDVLEIPADVDTSTGDVRYDGSVLIHGNVKSGFKVIAKGDVIVEGVVEGAIVKTDGQIVIKQGIHGMNKGVLDASGNILCKFIENAKVFCGGYIETEGIMHSKVSAATQIIVHGKKAIIAGGVIRAGSGIEAENIGSEMGAATVIEVGVDPAKKSRYIELKEKMQSKRKEVETIKPILKTFSEKMATGIEVPEDKLAYVQKLAVALKGLQAEMTEYGQEMDALHREISRGNDARVKVTKQIYPGVTITISDVGYTTKDTRSFCQFVRENGEVTIKNL